jgi:hypothetical protein
MHDISGIGSAFLEERRAALIEAIRNGSVSTWAYCATCMGISISRMSE